jgi:hypothetical protein
MKQGAIIISSVLLFAALILTSCKKDEDTTPPVITLEGFNPYTVCAGTEYFDAGATAVDDTDGDLTDQIVTNIQVDVSQPGEGTVTYEVSDAAGNTATGVREVIVIYCR